MIKLFHFTHKWELTGTTTPYQSRPRINDNEMVLHIPQIFRTGTSPSDGLMSYLGQSSQWGSYPSAQMQSAYTKVPSRFGCQKYKIIGENRTHINNISLQDQLPKIFSTVKHPKKWLYNKEKSDYLVFQLCMEKIYKLKGKKLKIKQR